MIAPRKTVSFPLGKIITTPEAWAALERAGQSPLEFLIRHVGNDWGEVCGEDWKINDQSLENGSMLLSAYRTAKQERLWVITQADRRCTTILLPDEY